MNDIFEKNAIVYAGEVARQAGAAVDGEIRHQWDSLEKMIYRIKSDNIESLDDLFQLLESEKQADNFQELILIDSKGFGYSLHNQKSDLEKHKWIDMLLNKKESIVKRSFENYLGQNIEECLVFGVPFEPFTMEKIEFVAIVGKYQLMPILEKLNVIVFEGKGMAHLIDQNGNAIMFHSNSVFSTFDKDNFFEILQEDAYFERGYTYEQLMRKAQSEQVSGAVIKINDTEVILSVHKIATVEWYLAISTLKTVTSDQTNSFFKLTFILFMVIAMIFGLLITITVLSRVRNTRDKLYREQLFQLISIHINDIFVIFDIDQSHFEYVSENMERMLGVNRESYISTKGKILDQYISENEVKKHSKAVADAKYAALNVTQETDPIITIFQWHNSVKKEDMWITLTIYTTRSKLFKEEKNEKLRCILVYTDCTKLKKREMDMERAVASAKGSEAAAIKAEKSKTLFFSSVSHEFRTPLNGIVGLLPLMEKSIHEPQKLKDYLSKASLSAKYLLSLINDILDMAKLESGMLQLNESEFNLFDILNEMETIFYYQTLEKGIRFQIIRNKIIYCYLTSDALRIQQIIINLLSNAVKFTEEGGEIVLLIEQEELDNDIVSTCFMVTDTGCGMSKDFLQRIGNPFEQEHLDHKYKYGGTGLGLAVCQQFIQLMGGQLRVESELGKGAKFYFELPLKIGKVPVTFSEFQSPEPTKQFEGMNFLVVEDNELNMEIMTTILEAMGIHCVCAENGKRAIQLFEESTSGYFHVIMLDIQMPVMDGYEAADLIRAMDRPDAEKVIIIACTANVLTDEWKDTRLHNMNGFFVKPIVIDDLIQLLYRLKEETSTGNS